MSGSRRAVSRWGWVGAVVTALVLGTAAPARGEVPPRLLEALGLARPTERAAAPGFTLTGLDGRPVSLAAARGRAVLLYFWATW